MIRDDPLTRLAFSIEQNRGVYALLVGSGVSRAAGIPTGFEITLDLIRRVAKAKGVPEQADWAQWYLSEFKAAPSYSDLMAHLAPSAEERRAILDRYIEPTDDERSRGKKVPTQAHRSIATLVREGFAHVVITTNFDRLLENALREQGIEPTVVDSTDSLKGAEPLVHSRCYVLKLHGDYKDARILNTEEELDKYPDTYDFLLDRILDDYGLIVCGWSGEWDGALRHAILRAPNRRYTTFWAARGEPTTLAHGLITHRKAILLQIEDADKFFSEVVEKVQVLERSQRADPLSVELFVETVKKYLARDEDRIRVNDLLAAEVLRVLEALRSNDFSASTPHPNATEFRVRVKLYEDLMEGLARAFGIFGRFGTGGELSLVTGIISNLYRVGTQEHSGFGLWIQIHSYPAVLLFTIYGVSLTKQQRWDDLYQLLTATIVDRAGQRTTFVETLYLWAWVGAGDDDTWQMLEGLDRKITALSDHLLEVVEALKESVLGVASEQTEIVFERFELLASMAFGANLTDEDLLRSNQSINVRDTLRMPVGRLGWHHRNLALLKDELTDSHYAQKIMNARFANTRVRLDLLFGQVEKWARRMRW
jgi:phosphoserine phosphatase